MLKTGEIKKSELCKLFGYEKTPKGKSKIYYDNKLKECCEYEEVNARTINILKVFKQPNEIEHGNKGKVKYHENSETEFLGALVYSKIDWYCRNTQNKEYYNMSAFMKNYDLESGCKITDNEIRHKLKQTFFKLEKLGLIKVNVKCKAKNKWDEIEDITKEQYDEFKEIEKNIWNEMQTKYDNVKNFKSFFVYLSLSYNPSEFIILQYYNLLRRRTNLKFVWEAYNLETCEITGKNEKIAFRLFDVIGDNDIKELTENFVDSMYEKNEAKREKEKENKIRTYEKAFEIEQQKKEKIDYIETIHKEEKELLLISQKAFDVISLLNCC